MKNAPPQGVFETIRCAAGHPFFLERHLERLARGAELLGLEVPADAERTLRAKAAELDPCALRVQLTRTSPELECSTRPLAPPSASGLVLALAEERLDPARLFTRIKHTERALYERCRAQARASGADDALLLTCEGDVCETSVANVWALVDDVLITPPLERGCLPGIMRAVLIEELAALGLACRIERLELDRMARASELFLTSALIRLAPVQAVLGSDWKLAGAYGPLSLRLGRVLAAAAERDSARRR